MHVTSFYTHISLTLYVPCLSALPKNQPYKTTPGIYVFQRNVLSPQLYILINHNIIQLQLFCSIYIFLSSPILGTCLCLIFYVREIIYSRYSVKGKDVLYDNNGGGLLLSYLSYCMFTYTVLHFA